MYRLMDGWMDVSVDGWIIVWTNNLCMEGCLHIYCEWIEAWMGEKEAQFMDW